MQYKIGDYVTFEPTGSSNFYKGEIIKCPSKGNSYYKIIDIENTEYLTTAIIRKLTFKEIIAFHIEKIWIEFIRWFY